MSEANLSILDEEHQEQLAKMLRMHGWQVRAPRDQFETPLQHAGHDTDHATVAKMNAGTSGRTCSGRSTTERTPTRPG